MLNNIRTKLKQNKHFLILFILGLCAGLPAALIGGTLQAWFTTANIDLKTIGSITLLSLPYNLRFLWAPLFDIIRIKGIDRRKTWLFLLLSSLALSILLMANYTPYEHITFFSQSIPTLLLMGVIVATSAASIEIVINAYTVELLAKDQQALGNAYYITGWRVGSIISGGIGLILAQLYGWQIMYMLMGLLMLISLTILIFAPTTECAPIIQSSNTKNRNLHQYATKKIILFFLIITTYKLSDALALALNTTFLLRIIHFDLATIGLINKTISMVAAVLGGIAAGMLMRNISFYKAILSFCFLQGLANLGYAILAYVGKSFILLVFTAFIENFFSGMGTIALMALIMRLCHRDYLATEIAILSSLAYLIRPIVGPLAANLIDLYGWFSFYILCFLITLPTIAFIFLAKSEIVKLK